MSILHIRGVLRLVGLLFLTPEMNYKYQSKGRDRLIFLSFNSPRLNICVHVWNGPEPLGREIAGHGLLLPRKREKHEQETWEGDALEV